MNLLDLARKDLIKITANERGFSTAIVFTPPQGLAVTVLGLAKKHHLGFNEIGVAVNVKTASCSVAERILTDAGYATRSSGEVSMIGHKVSWIDSSGANCQYVVREHFPDETIGLIVFILSDYE